MTRERTRDAMTPEPSAPDLHDWHTLEAAEALKAAGGREEGLTIGEAAERLDSCGPNA
jgi:hypothetical protein